MLMANIHFLNYQLENLSLKVQLLLLTLLDQLQLLGYLDKMLSKQLKLINGLNSLNATFGHQQCQLLMLLLVIKKFLKVISLLLLMF